MFVATGSPPLRFGLWKNWILMVPCLGLVSVKGTPPFLRLLLETNSNSLSAELCILGGPCVPLKVLIFMLVLTAICQSDHAHGHWDLGRLQPHSQWFSWPKLGPKWSAKLWGDNVILVETDPGGRALGTASFWAPFWARFGLTSFCVARKRVRGWSCCRHTHTHRGWYRSCPGDFDHAGRETRDTPRAWSCWPGKAAKEFAFDYVMVAAWAGASSLPFGQ